jgi:hypothetical protein
MRKKSELLCVASCWPKFELQKFAFKIPTFPTSKQFSIFRMSNANSCELLSCSLFSVSLAAVIALKSSICHLLAVLYAKSPKQTQQSTRANNSIFTIKIQESRQPKVNYNFLLSQKVKQTYSDNVKWIDGNLYR